MFTVYCHINKINGKRYVGITKQNPETRWRSGNGYNNSEYFWRAIKKYGWRNFEHVTLHENLTKEEAEKIEIKLIAEWKTTDGEYGYNIANGGNHIGSVSEETKRKISKRHKGVATELHRTEETKRKISKGLKGIKRSDETKKKMSDFAKSRGMSEMIKQRFIEANEKRKIPVICIETGIKYESASEAARQTGLCKSTILRHCNRTYKKKKWRYAEDNKNISTWFRYGVMIEESQIERR